MKIGITELRRNLSTYVERARTGTEILVCVRGKVVARLCPGEDRREVAGRRLEELRSVAFVGDVESPIDEAWQVDS